MLAKTKNQAKIKRNQREFIKAMKKKFAEPHPLVQSQRPNLNVRYHVTLIPYAYEGRK